MARGLGSDQGFFIIIIIILFPLLFPKERDGAMNSSAHALLIALCCKGKNPRHSNLLIKLVSQSSDMLSSA